MASTSDADASDPESIKRKLIKSLASSWEEVVQIYEQDPRAHKIEIGPSRTQNRDWNNPLHLGPQEAFPCADASCLCIRSGIHLGWFNKIIYHPHPAGTSKAKKNFFQELRKLGSHLDPENPEEGQGIEHHGHNSRNIGAQEHKPFHSKYGRCLREKEMHMWSLQILNKLLERSAARCTYEMNPKMMRQADVIWKFIQNLGMTPILLASRNGIVEMVEKILQLFPLAIHDTNRYNENIVLTAVENRQSHIYDFLLNSSHLIDKEGAFHAVGCEGNNALHLAGKLAGDGYLQRIPTSMLQMQWEVKWYQVCKTQAKI
ncbi:hypothetical protein AAG906_032929 [Vitis piasezkii]